MYVRMYVYVCMYAGREDRPSAAIESCNGFLVYMNQVSSISFLAIDDYDDRDLPLIKARATGLQARIRDIINPVSPSAAAVPAGEEGQHVIVAACQINVQVS